MTLSYNNPRILQRLPAHTSDVTSCDLAPNFNLVTGSSDKTIRIWEWIPSKGYVERQFSPLRGHKYGVTCVKVSPQGSMLATASVDGTAVLWNLHSGAKIYTMTQVNGDAIRVCRFTPDSSVLATGGDNGAICFWDLIHRGLIRTLFQHEGTTQGLTFTPDSMYAVSGCTLEILNVWSMQDVGDTTRDDPCEPVASQDNTHDLGVICVDASPVIAHEENNPMMKSYTIATSGNCEKIYLWKVTCYMSHKHMVGRNQVTIEKTLTLRGHSSAVTCVRYNHNGSVLASSSLDKLVKIWSSNGSCISTLAGHSRYINCVSFSRDSNLISSGSTGSNDKSVIVWDLTGTLSCDSELIKNQTHWSNMTQNCRVQESHVVRDAEASDNSVTLLEKIDDIAEAAINSCHFYGDDLLATGSSDKMVRLFRVDPERDGILEESDGSPLDGHAYSVNHVEFSKDGSLLASSSLDGWTILWNPRTAEKVTALPESSNGIRVSKFSPDGLFILTAGDDEKGTIWNVNTKEKVCELEGHLDAITSAAYTPDGKMIATMSNNGDFRLWAEGVNIFTKDDAHDLGVQSCDFSQNLEPIPNTIDAQNYLLVTCGNDSMVKLWVISVQTNWGNYDYKTTKVKLWKTLQGHGGSVTYVRLSSTGEIACSTATDRQARIWSAYSGECLHVLDHDTIVTTCAFSASCSMLAVGCLDKTLWIWKLPQQLVFQTAVANKLKCKIKAVVDWSLSDVLKWLDDVGLSELRDYLSNTTLNGEKILTTSENEICSGLNLGEEQTEKLTKEIKWLKQMEFVEPSKWDKPDIPMDFLCPITHEIMREPVTVSDGFTYEKRAITEWFMSGKFTSPMTNVVLPNTDYKPNIELRNAIYSYLYDNN